MALTLPQQRNKRGCTQCNTLVFWSLVFWSCRGFSQQCSTFTPRGQPAAYPSSASPPLLVVRHYHPPAGQPPSLNPSIILDDIFLHPPILALWDTSWGYLFINPHSQAASQYRKHVCSLSLSSELQKWEKAGTVLSFSAEKWLMRDIHSAFVKPRKYPTLLDLNGRCLPAPRSFIPTFGTLPSPGPHI